MKYNIITDLSSTHFGSYELSTNPHDSPREIDYKDCLYFEASQTLAADSKLPKDISAITFIQKNINHMNCLNIHTDVFHSRED